MKKILMFLCCVIMSNSLWAVGPNCPATRSLSLGLLQNGKDNEFVYTNQEVYDEVRNGSGDRKLTKGWVYECGKKGCDKNTILLAGNDWILASRDFDGGPRSVAGKLLICSTAGGDSWTDFSFDECEDDRVRNDTRPKWEQRKVENDRLTDCYSRHRSGGFYDFCCFTGEHAACMRAALRGEPALWNGGKCSCGNRDEGDTREYTWDPQGKRCISMDGASKLSCKNVVNSGNTVHGGSETFFCSELYEGADLCKHKCNDGKWSEWEIISCREKEGYKLKNGKCVKKTQSSNPNSGNNNGGGSQTQSGGNNGGSQTQSGGNNGGNGTVVTPPAGGNGGVNIELQQYECPEPVNGYLYWRSQYKDCSDVIAGLNELEEYCKSGDRTESGYKSRIAGLEKLRDQCKEEAARNQRITRSTAIISDASKKLDDIMAGLKISVWKTAEGNFNSARLASDSIAGVVLGTAGGLITSHLVKKGQVKNGFEDIQCTVGGQKVADWGDEFTVGIR